jgi:thioredoxin 1
MILYFTADWCVPCKNIKPVVQEVNAELGLGISFVDVDQQKEIAQRYGVTSVPTIVVENGGNVLYRSLGVMSKPQLKQVLSQFK